MNVWWSGGVRGGVVELIFKTLPINSFGFSHLDMGAKMEG